MTILEVARLLCFLTPKSNTSPMDGQMNVLVRRCIIIVKIAIKRHQIYYDDQCPKVIYKDTKSLYR